MRFNQQREGTYAEVHSILCIRYARAGGLIALFPGILLPAIRRL